MKQDWITKIAGLARLELSEAEAATYGVQLGQILEHVHQLGDVSVEGVEPLIHPISILDAVRTDEVRAFELSPEGHSRVLDSAPDVLQHSFKVPPIL